MTLNSQPGISVRPPAHLLVAALTFVQPTDTALNTQTLQQLRELLRRELAGDLDELVASTPKDQPTAETGEVGGMDYWDNGSLTVDVGFSSTGYAALGFTTNLPADLIAIPWDRLGPLVPTNPVSGDLVLHIRSNNVLAVEHVLRRDGSPPPGR